MFSFQGRSGRLAYLGLTFLGALLAAAGFVGGALIDRYYWGESEEGRIYLALMAIALMTPGLWIWLAVSVRRCHDVGWSGWWTVLRIIPLAAVIQFIWLLFASGDQAENRFGPPPGTRASDGVIP